MVTASYIKLFSFIIFLLLSAFFSSAETAFTAISPIKLRSLIDSKKKGALLLERLLKTPRKLIITILIGNNIANVAASALATTVILNQLLKYNLFHFAYGMALVTGIMTFILLTFGEITPKTIAIKQPEKLALFMARPLYLLMVLLHPMVTFFLFLSKFLSKMLGIPETVSSALLTQDELKAAVSMSKEEGLIEKQEHEMITSIIDFSDTVVREVMTPRPDAVCIDVSGDIRDVIDLIVSKGHSRIPVYEETLDNIIGVVYAKDLLRIQKTEGQAVPIKRFLREVAFIPETKSIESLLHQMKVSKFHIAIVVDEYGGFSGLITLEDIIEEIFGEIQDEYDDDENPLLVTLGPQHYLVDARIHIEELAEKLNVNLPENEDDYDTFGGFVLSLIGHFPKKNDQVSYDNLHITVKETRKRRILKCEVLIQN